MVRVPERLVHEDLRVLYVLLSLSTLTVPSQSHRDTRGAKTRTLSLSSRLPSRGLCVDVDLNLSVTGAFPTRPVPLLVLGPT